MSTVPQPGEVTQDFGEHLRRVQHEMTLQGLDYLVVTPSADFIYLTGTAIASSHRLVALVVPASGEMHLVASLAQVRQMGSLPASVAVEAWNRPANPISVIQSLLTGRRPVLGIGSDMLALHLLALQDKVAGAKYVTADTVMRRARMVKTLAEVDLLRRVSRAADAVCEELPQLRFAGMSEIELDHLIRRLDIEKGHDALAAGGGVWIGENSGDVAMPRTDRRAQAGDAIQLDIGGVRRHYNSDISRVLHMRPPNDEYVRLYNAVNASQQAGFEAAVVGALVCDIYQASLGVVRERGYEDFFGSGGRIGHGIGLDHDEYPPISAEVDLPLEAGMVLTIEPGVYIPGRFGARVEDTILITEKGPERLNRFTHDLCFVD